MNNKYEFESQRLGFRRWREEDRPLFASMNANDKVMKYFPNKLNRQQSDSFIDNIKKHFSECGYGLWVVEVKDTKEFIGFIGFYTATFEAYFTPCVEIGWRLDHKYWNKGYATEGANACLKYGFEALGLEVVYSFTAKTNTPSSNVMKKIGLNKEDEFYHPKLSKEDPLCLHVLYKVNKDDYMNK